MKMIKSKSRNRNKARRVRTSLKIKIKNQMLLSFKMIIKISKELEKFVNMIKKFKSILKRKVIWTNREIKSIQK